MLVLALVFSVIFLLSRESRGSWESLGSLGKPGRLGVGALDKGSMDYCFGLLSRLVIGAHGFLELLVILVSEWMRKSTVDI